MTGFNGRRENKDMNMKEYDRACFFAIPMDIPLQSI